MEENLILLGLNDGSVLALTKEQYENYLEERFDD